MKFKVHVLTKLISKIKFSSVKFQSKSIDMKYYQILPVFVVFFVMVECRENVLGKIFEYDFEMI